MRRTMPPPGRILLALLAMLAVFALLTNRPANPALLGHGAPTDVTVYVVDNGLHTDIAIPRAALTSGPLADAVRGLPPSLWVLAGWGDANFYTHDGFTTARAVDGLRALFWPGNPSVIRVSTLDRPPPLAYPHDDLVEVRLSPPGATRLVARIDRSLENPLRETARWGVGDRFYASREHFSLVHLCNHWTGEVLNAGGVADHPVLDTIPSALRWALRRTPTP